MWKLLTLAIMGAGVGAANTNEMNYLVLGDWGGPHSGGHGTTTPAQIADGVGMANFASKIGGIDFVIGVGDNIYPNGIRTDEHDPRFKETFENVYNQSELQVPFYQILGNHDHMKGANTTAQIAYSGHGSGRWIMPALWYTFTRSFNTTNGNTISTQFIYVDTSILYGLEWEDEETGKKKCKEIPIQSLAPEQLIWLNKTLAASTADYIWLVGHYPIFDPADVAVKKYNDFVPLLKKYNATGYLSGHCHTMQYHESTTPDNLKYVLSGCGTECNRPIPGNSSIWNPYNVTQSYVHSNTDPQVDSAFVAIKVNETAMYLQYISDKGILMYEAKPIHPRK